MGLGGSNKRLTHNLEVVEPTMDEFGVLRARGEDLGVIGDGNKKAFEKGLQKGEKELERSQPKEIEIQEGEK